MKHILSLFLALFACSGMYAQHTIRLSIKNSEEKTPLAGATVIISPLNKTVIADSLGVATFTNIAAGAFTIKVSYVGLEEKEVSITVPMPSDEPFEILLEEGEEEEEEVIVTTTRTSRSINDIPTRVETISGEELTEKGNMKPGDIRMLLNESTGIQTQQTSATSYNSSIRIQGLDGSVTNPTFRDIYAPVDGFVVNGGIKIRL